MNEALDVSRGRDVLVVDDNVQSLTAIESAIAPLGRRIVFARSGVEALGRLLDQDFALILLDIAMPGMDGFETARLVRTRERNRSTPIIFITGHQWADDQVLRSYELGAFDFMMKPVQPELLRAKARVYIELQERTLALREAQELAHERELGEQRRRLEAEAMERQMAQLAETDRKKDEFLAILAHELRNPLQPMKTAVDLLARGSDIPNEELIGILDKRLRHVTRLVDDLLDVARYANGKLTLYRQAVVLREAIQESVAACRANIDGRAQSLELDAPANTVIVDADPVRLVQILSNLVNNASKYTQNEGRIAIAWEARGDRAIVRVADNGRGIASEVLPKIFEMFVQERVAFDGYGGLGLGLGLVKRLVELHGGQVRADSAGPGHGSTFEIELPLFRR